MTGGLLLFEDSPRGSWTAGCRFGGLTTLERGILTMARAGVDRLLVAVPAGLSAPGRRVRRLDIDLEIAGWGDSPRTTFGPSEEVLILLGDHVHHHSSLTALVESGASGDGLVVQGLARARPGGAPLPPPCRRDRRQRPRVGQHGSAALRRLPAAASARRPRPGPPSSSSGAGPPAAG